MKSRRRREEEEKMQQMEARGSEGMEREKSFGHGKEA
jgi:hypothetical protein